MITFKLILLLTALVNKVYCEVNKTKAQNVSNICNNTLYTDLKNFAVNIDKYCKGRTCIAKCCPSGQILTISRKGTFCEPAKSSVDYSKFCIHNNDFKNRAVCSKTLNDYKLVLNKKFHPGGNNTCIQNPTFIRKEYQNFYIVEDGTLYRHIPNYYQYWSEERGVLEYCIDIVVINKKTGPVSMAGYVLLNSEHINNTEVLTKFSTYSILISCFFLLLVLIIYSLLPKLRRIAGMVLMAYVISLLATFLLKIFKEFLHVTSKVCRTLAPIMYFTTLSSFFWLNIMSFDTWWTFRGFRKQRDIHRRGETVKFLWYCLYAWGTPALISTVYTIIDRVDFSRWPTFPTPHLESCLASKYETILYLYVPLFIIIVANCILFIMTTYNIWIAERKLNSFSSNGSSKNNTNNRNRFRIYKTLSVIMGVNWVLELIHTFNEDTSNIALYISMDLYNSLIGVVIFFLFVFKKNIFIMLCEKFKIKKYTLNNQSSTNHSKCSESVKKTGSVKSNENTEMTATV